MSVLVQRSASSADAVKLKHRKILSGFFPRSHSRSGSAWRNTNVGVSARWAVRSATLPRSHVPGRRSPSDDITITRAFAAAAFATSISSALHTLTDSMTSTPRFRLAAAVSRSDRLRLAVNHLDARASLFSACGNSTACASVRGASIRRAKSVATSTARSAAGEKSVPHRIPPVTADTDAGFGVDFVFHGGPPVFEFVGMPGKTDRRRSHGMR